MTNSILRGSAFAHAVSLQVAVVAGPWAKCSASLQPGPAGHIVEAFRETLFLSLSVCTFTRARYKGEGSTFHVGRNASAVDPCAFG